MPKQTFFNLPLKKRNLIIETALEEFAIYDYNSASINRIVKKAKISKGSIYQYFTNKKELYLYLIDFAAEHKLKTLSQQVDLKLNFFSVLKQMHLIGAQFDLSHPKISRLLINSARETNEELGNMTSQILKKSDQFFINFIATAQQKGQIRSDIDISLISFFISRISVSLSDYVSSQYNYSYEQIIKDGVTQLPVDNLELETILNNVIEILQHGLTPGGGS